MAYSEQNALLFIENIYFCVAVRMTQEEADWFLKAEQLQM